MSWYWAISIIKCVTEKWRILNAFMGAAPAVLHLSLISSELCKSQPFPDPQLNWTTSLQATASLQMKESRESRYFLVSNLLIFRKAIYRYFIISDSYHTPVDLLWKKSSLSLSLSSSILWETGKWKIPLKKTGKFLLSSEVLENLSILFYYIRFHQPPLTRVTQKQSKIWIIQQNRL